MEPNTSNAPQESATSSGVRHPAWPHPVLTGVVILVVLLVGGYAWLQGSGALSEFSPSQQDTTSQGPQGILFVSATVATSTGETIGAALFTINAANDDREYLPVSKLTSGSAITLQHATVSDLSSIVFLGTPLVGGTATQGAPSVYYADLTSATSLNERIALTQDATAIAPPTTSDYFREFPSVSTSHIVAYSSLSKSQYESAQNALASLDADEWSIYILDANNLAEKRRIANGLAPKWVNEHVVAYLKDDGVYTYNLTTGQELQVWKLAFTPNAATGFDVSDDGQFLVVAHPEGSTFVVLRALDWATSLLTSVAEVHRGVMSPVISPDDAYIAMFIVNEQGDTQVVYYSLAENAFVKELAPFHSSGVGDIYLTDWRY